jgi:hypothetical protein
LIRYKDGGGAALIHRARGRTASKRVNVGIRDYAFELVRQDYRKQFILERTDLAKGLTGQYVELYDFADRPLEVKWKGVSLPYRVFSKDQRVTHTAIVENKQLGHALALVKAHQDLRHAPKVMTNSEKMAIAKDLAKYMERSL